MSSVEDYYLAGLCAYSGHPLVEVRTEGRNTTFVFDIQPWSYDELAEAFDSTEGQPISSVKHYADALQRLTALQRKSRQSTDGVWTDPRWIRGESLKRHSEPIDCGTWNG